MEWNFFYGILISQDNHHITTELTCKLSGKKWFITNIYGPAHNENINDFFNWIAELDFSQMQYWMILGDFNLLRARDDKIRPGGDNNNMMLFNTMIRTPPC
jgi:hypothetical protein